MEHHALMTIRFQHKCPRVSSFFYHLAHLVRAFQHSYWLGNANIEKGQDPGTDQGNPETPLQDTLHIISYQLNMHQRKTYPSDRQKAVAYAPRFILETKELPL